MDSKRATTAGQERRITVVLADDHDLVREGIKTVLGATAAHIEVTGEARNGDELVALVRRLQPDVILTDVSMPNMDGISALPALRLQAPDSKVLVLSSYSSVDFVRRAVALGAHGYVMKDAPIVELAHAIEAVVERGVYYSPSIAQALLTAPPDPLQDLTPRQLQILQLIADGKGSKQIGFELGLSPKTVDVHRSRLMERLGINSVTELTLYAVKLGLAQTPEKLLPR